MGEKQEGERKKKEEDAKEKGHNRKDEKGILPVVTCFCADINQMQ